MAMVKAYSAQWWLQRLDGGKIPDDPHGRQVRALRGLGLVEPDTLKLTGRGRELLEAPESTETPG